MRFRELLILKRWEWIPLLSAILLNGIVGGWGIYQIVGQIEADSMDTDRFETVCSAVNATKWVAIPPLVFACTQPYSKRGRLRMEVVRLSVSE